MAVKKSHLYKMSQGNVRVMPIRSSVLDYHYHKLTQSPNGEQIAISPKTQWESESTGEKSDRISELKILNKKLI